MWQAPNQRVKAIQNAKKRQMDRLRRPIHIRRVRAGFKIVNGGPVPFSEVQVLLNDLSPLGIGIYTPQFVSVGQEITLALDEPKPIFLRGKVIWCQEIHSSSHVISSAAFAYRVGIKFLFGNEEERKAVESYCAELFRNYLHADAPI